MSKRKGQLSQAEVNRRWPHQVAILATVCRGPLKDEIDAFCKPYPECSAPHQINYQDKSYLVKCFPEKEIAEEFVQRFGGEPFNPKDRGKGKWWFQWNRPAEPAKADPTGGRARGNQVSG